MRYKLDAMQIVGVPRHLLNPPDVIVHRADAKAPSIKHVVYFKHLGWAINKGYTLHTCIPPLTEEERQALVASCPALNWEPTIR